ncbi:hypothetical protein [Pontibacter fetidus]|uniref:Uncharacterized protein n=1 Tax=Pontibacter fetidus TaxID=2700082 RepID=A0A6B2H8S9_9BACT|nr:hypothetical protein [Pontibacter fetidus]NDK55842.1 hypothetical protein [Pontibacter fetidus]
MKTYVSDVFPKLQRFSEKLDNLTLLTEQHWVSIDNIHNTKQVYNFRDNNDLLISTDGKIEKGKWEYLGNKSLMIEKPNESYLFKHGFFDENILALKIDSKNEYAVFVNENKYNGDINSLEKVSDFLENKYIESSLKANNFHSNETLSHISQSKVEKVRIEKIKKLERESNKYFIILIVIIAITGLLIYLDS